MPRNRAPLSTSSARPRILNQDGIKRDIIVIGASAGGVVALSELFAAFPPHMPASVSVVLHRAASRGQLAHVLGRRAGLQLIETETTLPLKHRRIYLAPPDHHLLIFDDHVEIHRGPKEHSTRPAVDPLFRSAAEHHGPRVVGLLLTGCGEDGVSGLIAISKANGVTLVQDPDEAYMPYMPLNALRFDEISGVFGIKELAPALAALAEGRSVPVKRR